jgi:hypothetical protein
LYISEASEYFRLDDDLDDILESSNKNNSKENITGILIKNDKFFIQLLEGKKSSVEKIYSKISKDDRHRSLRILMDYNSDERIFPEWAMGYVELGANNETKLKDLIPLIHKDVIKLSNSKQKVLAIHKKLQFKEIIGINLFIFSDPDHIL